MRLIIEAEGEDGAHAIQNLRAQARHLSLEQSPEESDLTASAIEHANKLFGAATTPTEVQIGVIVVGESAATKRPKPAPPAPVDAEDAHEADAPPLALGSVIEALESQRVQHSGRSEPTFVPTGEKLGCCGPGEGCSSPECTGTPLTTEPPAPQPEVAIATDELPPAPPEG